MPDLGKAGDAIGNAAKSTLAFVQGTPVKLGKQLDNLKEKNRKRAEEKQTGKKPDPYDEAVAKYNASYEEMRHAGTSLLHERVRALDLIDHVEGLVNSIANTPKSFNASLNKIESFRRDFHELQEFAKNEIEDAKRAAVGAGAGLAAGTAVAAFAPAATMWAATTFGTASTGTAISALSGAASTKAALALIGGGTLATGGSGVAGGTVLLAMAGPIGWTIAGTALLASVALFTKNKIKTRKERERVLAEVKEFTSATQGTGAQITALLQKTSLLRNQLLEHYEQARPLFGTDYATLSDEQQSLLVTLVNNTLVSAALLEAHIDEETEDE